MEKQPRFKTGARIKFTQGAFKGHTGIIMGPVANAQIEAYKIGLVVGRNPYDQRHWLKISAKFLEYASVIDQLGDILGEDDELIRCGHDR